MQVGMIMGACRNKSARREQALARQAERALRSPAEQLKLLDKRFGRGKGCERERRRLENTLRAIEARAKPAVAAEAEGSPDAKKKPSKQKAKHATN